MAKEDKPKKKHEQLRKPAASIDFDNLQLAIVDGRLVVDKSVQLVLRRARAYEMITLCRVLRTYPDGTVVLMDETIGEQFMFNLQDDIAVHTRLRIYDKSKTKKLSRNVPVADEESAEEEVSTWNESVEQYVESDDADS